MSHDTPAPRAPERDSTLALLREGYAFISNRCDALGSDLFRCRLALRPAICLRGAEAAELFYDEARFGRRHATPGPILAVLQGRGSVATLDDDAHRRRKERLMRFMTPDRVAAFRDAFAARWRARAGRWVEEGAEPSVADAAREDLGETAIAWCGLTLDPAERRTLIEAAAACVEGAQPISVRHFAARRARAVSDALLGREVERVRARPEAAPEDSPLRALALAEEAGRRLPVAVAVVELQNLIRPAVAIARFVADAAHALAFEPAERAPLAAGDPEALRAFAWEVRRLYPLFPFVAARARGGFAWRGAPFRPGTLAVLDLFGTNRSPALYDRADAFHPSRWRGRRPGPFELIAQGGGGFAGHRCAGEWITQASVEAAAEVLAGLDFEADPAAREVRLDRMPFEPRDGMRLGAIRRRPARTAA